MRVSTCKFRIHVYKCGLKKSKCLNESIFESQVMMKMKISNLMESYENYFHKNGYCTLICHEHLKK